MPLRVSWPTLYIVAGEVGHGHRSRCAAIAEMWGGPEVWDLPRPGDEPGLVLVDHKVGAGEIIADMHELGHLAVHIEDEGSASTADLYIHYQSAENRVTGRHFVSLIGTDYFPLAARFRRSGMEVQPDRVVILPGSTRPTTRWGHIKRELEGMGIMPEMLQGMPPMEYADHLATAGVVISAASVSAFEACGMGKMVFLVELLPEHRMGARALVESGAAMMYDPADLRGIMHNRSEQERFRQRAVEVIDGNGVARIIRYMKRLCRQKELWRP